VNIIEELGDPRFLGPSFRDLSTWRAWMVFLRALFGLPIEDPEDLRVFREATSLEEAPSVPAREAFVIAGRRSGKSTISAAIAVYLATCRNWREVLGAGETGFVFIIATDKLQALIIKRYVSEILRRSPSFRAMVKQETREAVELKNGVNIEVKTASFRGVRGYTLIAAILEELAFWRATENYANIDKEILTAVRPALGNVPGSVLIGISTAYMMAGTLYDAFRRYWGKSGSTIVWRAPTLTMNPTYSKEEVEKALAEDYESARAEYLSEWRADISSFLSFDAVQACVIPGRLEIAPLAAKTASYVAFIDPSGGRNDSFTLAIAHRSKAERAVLDVLREIRPPFNPSQVVAEFASLLKRYKVDRVESDRYGGEWICEAFAKEGIIVEPASLTVSELYLEALPMILSGSAELLDIPRLISQLVNLERRARTGGRDLVTHVVGLHDDLANAVSGALYLAGSEASSGPVIFAASAPYQRDDDDRPRDILSRDDIEGYLKRSGGR
jgi:bifunctional DNA-binding transcriptional regulator/antitoxin component of YhaV-PrlF toxin-antitoxin module